MLRRRRWLAVRSRQDCQQIIVALLEIATRRGVRLISDETYRYLSRAPLPPTASLDLGVSIGTMSKTHELPGLGHTWR
jgi:aspartate/methionine/tyrosine aminotransferase